MKKFSRSEIIFLDSTVAVGIFLLVIARVQFVWAETEGLPAGIPASMPTALTWLGIAALVWVAYLALHRMIPEHAQSEV